jgi:UDP-glucose:(heptosyl)LPS alpha-1,3-glucosyltransferase
LTFAWWAPRTIAKYDCDIVMSFDRTLSQDIFRSGGGPRKLMLEKLKSHSRPLRRLWYAISPYHCLTVLLEKFQVRNNRSGKIIAISEQVKREFMQVYGMPEEQIVVIYNGVDGARFNPRRRANEGRRVREQFEIPSDAPVVLFVGTGFRRKGLNRLLDLWRRRELPGVYLLIVGNDLRLARYRRLWKHEKEVIFAGPRANVEDYYACGDVLVLPAVQEAFGNVVLEAMSSGLPVVASPEVGAINGMNGALAEGIVSGPDNAAELKAKISAMLDHRRWPVLARQARLMAEQYTWDKYLDRLEQTLFECSGQSFLDKSQMAAND